jgi:hypothetical protein
VRRPNDPKACVGDQARSPLLVLNLPTIPVYNAHRRKLLADVDTVGAMVDCIGAEGDQLWPVTDGIPISIERPLRIGSLGGHGPASYRVVGYQPGRWLRMEFSRPRCIIGFHEFTVEPDGAAGSILQHLLAVRLRPFGWLLYPIGLKTLHDQVIEALLDRAELATSVTSTRPPLHFTPAVRARIAVMRLYRQLRL